MRSIALLVALLTIAPALAQEGGAAAPVTMQLPEGPLMVHGGSTQTFDVLLSGQDAQQPYQVTLSVKLPSTGNWAAVVEPDSIVLAAGDERIVTVTVTADKHPAPRAFDLRVEATAVGQDFTTHRLDAELATQATGTEAILGRWENPLPAPLDNQWGSFLLNFVAWWIIGLATMWLISPTLKVLTMRTKTELDDKIIKIISRPAFILVFTFGIVRSLQVFALPASVFRGLESLWAGVLGIVVIYVAYKLWHGIVLAIGQRVAQKTESELDDRLYPVLEKVGGIIIVVIGIFYVLGSFGVDLTLFAAGGAIGGLVIAFAAQDTLANFFAGIFILLDRPFRVGDRIELPEQNHWGDVQRIGLRTTSVRTQDNRMVIFPNNYIGSNPIVNHSYPDHHYRIQVDFKLPYGSDIEFVRKTLVDAARPVEGVWADRDPEALLLEFTDHGQLWRLRWWINSYVDTRRMFDRVNSAVMKRMAEEGIRIQYHPLTLWDAHKLLERDSKGGLAPERRSDAEEKALEDEAEASRKKHEQVEAAEIEELKAAHKRKASQAKKERGKKLAGEEEE